MQRYDVFGMSCAACSAHVQKAVENVSGVKNVSVNLLTNSMTVECSDDDKNLSSKIISAVQKAGYDAKLADGKNPALQKKSKGALDSETKKLLRRFVISFCLLLPLMYVSMGVMMWDFPLPPFVALLEQNGISHAFLTGVYEAVLSLIILVINRKFFISGVKAVFNRSPNMDTLVSLGSGISYLYSLYNLFPVIVSQFGGSSAMAHSSLMHGMPDLYFESAAMIVTLITIGKTLESFSKGKTADALNSLMELAPQTAVVFSDGKEIPVSVEELKTGDVIIVKTGESIAVDGVIIEGSASINESNLTGESIPVDKVNGSEVFASTLCVSGRILVKATKVGQETSFAKIIQLVTDASASKAPIAKAADRVSAVFVPVVLGIALLTFAVWILSGAELSFAINCAVCVLVISCPCSLGLATPVSIMVGNGIAAKKGILFKTASSLEAVGKIQVCVMDKTGTVTNGKPVVTDVVSEIDRSEFLSYAFALEKNSSHPLANAISDYCTALLNSQDSAIIQKKADNFSETIGRGVMAVIDGKTVKAGNEKFIFDGLSSCAQSVREQISDFAEQGKTPLLFSIDDKYAGMICVSDTEKETSREAVRILNSMQIETVLLTGDNEKTAKAIASRVGIEKVYANVQPDQKEKIVAELSRTKKTAMVGDGVNDAPSLKRAFVGIAIGAGTDVALDAADVVLLKNDLLDVVRAVSISRGTLKNIHENLFWAFFYNAVCIPVAAGALAFLGIFLKPMYGAFAMSLSSFCVVMNALRLNLLNVENTIKKAASHNLPSNKKLPDEKSFTEENKKSEQKLQGESCMKKTLKINGMMCAHCQQHVKDALDKIEGVKTDVDYKAGTAVVEFSGDVSDDTLKNAVKEQGYEVIEIY
ncbi:MAG: heavy metal translocating P-type ATPase [Treponema sp.]